MGGGDPARPRGAELLGRAGHPWLQAIALTNLAMAALRGGTGSDLKTATTAIEQATELLPVLGDDLPMRAIVHARRSVILHACDRADLAYPVLAETAEAMTGTWSQFELAPIIEAHAALLAQRDPTSAARLLGLAEAVRDNQEHAQPLLLQPADETAATCRTRLGAAEYARAHQFGASQHRHGLPDALTELLTSTPDGAR